MISTFTAVQPKPRHASAKVRSVDLAGPAGRLEAIVNEGAAEAPFAAMVCHPHPLGGGNLHNKVVYHAMKAMNDPHWGFSWPVLRFNFRGTERSHGKHDGAAEAEDVLAALRWLGNEYSRPLVVVGFSFGAAMALAASCRPLPPAVSVRGIAALGLPTHAQNRDYAYRFLKDCTLPKLFLSGDHDQFAPTGELARIAAEAAEPKRLALIPGADHFFRGQLESMQRVLAGWLKEALP